MAFLDKTGLERLWSQILSKLSNKVDKIEGKGLSTNDYTTEDKNKVENSAYKIHTHTEYDTKGAAEDALSQAKNYTNTQVATRITETEAREIIDEAVSGISSTNSFVNVKVDSTTITADSATDTLTFVAGNNITLTPDANNDSVTISATNTTYSAATTSANGLMTAAMVTKLNGIAAGANAYTHPTHTAKSSGLYKVTVDGNGHVSAATAVQKSDITALGIPAQDTTYSAASTSANGLMTTTMVSKLNGIATGAEVNQNAFSNIIVGSTTIAADAKTDSLTLVAGNNVTITPDATNDKITIAATDTVYTHPTSAGNKHIPSGGSSGQILRWSASGTAVWGDDNNTTYSNATTSAAGLMSAADKSKLDGIAANANNYTYTLPTASTTLGGVKTTSSVTSTSGLTACPIINGVVYYKDTNDTYSLSSFGVTATATELNYVDGVTSSIQTQLNNKLASSSSGYIKSLSISGKTITYTKGDNSTGTLTTQDTTYTLPNASSSTLGGVKVGSNITVSSGTISLTKSNVTSALGYTPLSSAPVTSVNSKTGAVSLSAGDVGALSLAEGGTVTGDITVSRADGTSVIVSVNNGANKINLQVSDSGNKGIYNSTLAKWLVYANSDNEVRVNNTTQTVTSACLRNIKGGTAALTAGSSELASGDIYIQYE